MGLMFGLVNNVSKNIGFFVTDVTFQYVTFTLSTVTFPSHVLVNNVLCSYWKLFMKELMSLESNGISSTNLLYNTDSQICAILTLGIFNFETASENVTFMLFWIIQSTDHELIPARNVGLAAVQGSATGSNVGYYSTWKHSPFKERNEQGCYNAIQKDGDEDWQRTP
jgi:hypothetical protein